MSVCLQYQPVVAVADLKVSVRWQLCVATLLLLTLIAKVWIKVETTRVGYELADQRQLAIELDMKQRELELHRSYLLRPDNLYKTASAKLGLVKLQPQQAKKVIYVN